MKKAILFTLLVIFGLSVFMVIKVSFTAYAVSSITSNSKFVRGDANNDGSVNLADAIFIFTYLFSSGTAPSCLDATDVDDNGVITVGDGISVLNYLFSAGPQPKQPFPEAGYDTTTNDEWTCGDGEDKNCFSIQNIVFVKVMHNDTGFNPSVDYASFGQVEINKRAEHFKRTLAWLTNNPNVQITTNFIEYHVDYNHDSYTNIGSYTPLSDADYEKILNKVFAYNPDVVILQFEGGAINTRLGEKIVNNKIFSIVQIGEGQPRDTDEETLKGNLKSFSHILVHEIGHCSFVDAYFRWCGGLSSPENPADTYPFINCRSHGIYGADYNYEFPPFLVYTGRAEYTTLDKRTDNTYNLDIPNTCKNNKIIKIPDGLATLGDNVFSASYVFSLTDRKSCENEFQDFVGQIGVQIYRNFEYEDSPSIFSYEIPFRYEKSTNNEYTALNPITFSKKYAGTVPNFGSWHDIRDAYVDNNYEVKVISENIGPNGEIDSVRLEFKIKNDELASFRQ